ncbi:MAG: peptide deformylase [Patescibacteria group bacterium]
MPVLPIISNITELRRKCRLVEKGEDISQIIQDLKNTLNYHKNGLGLAANQIGYNKAIAIVKIPKNKTEFTEHILINPQIIDKEGKIIINDSCLSFPGLIIRTLRYSNITFYNTNLKGEVNTFMVSGLEGIVIQHEVDHCLGITILDRRYKNPNKKRK